MTKLAQAIQYANAWHDGQMDKLGVPYIFHPLRVMEMIRKNGHPEDAQIAAVLHDVLEDASSPAMQDFRARMIITTFSITTSGLLQLLTRSKDLPYADYIARIAKNETATQIKIADIIDNVERLPLLRDTEQRLRLAKKYRAALDTLGIYQPGAH